MVGADTDDGMAVQPELFIEIRHDIAQGYIAQRHIVRDHIVRVRHVRFCPLDGVLAGARMDC